MLQVHLGEGLRGWGGSFLTDVSSLPPRVAPCRVSDFFSHHARAGMQLVGALTALVLLLREKHLIAKIVMSLYIICDIFSFSQTGISVLFY